MAIVAFWLFLGFFVGSLAIVWWALYVDHDLKEEPEEAEDDTTNPLAGVDGVRNPDILMQSFTACVSCHQG